MNIDYLHVQGLRSIEDLEIPLHDMTIFIGRNNAGKSNLLKALHLLLEASAKNVSPQDFHQHGDEQTVVDEIVLKARVSGVSPYLSLCADRHRPRIEACIEDGDSILIRRKLTLVDKKVKIGKIEIWQPDNNAFGSPTGIDAGLKAFLPEVIFIEAFKDPGAEAQAKSTATLGKLIKQIVEQISSQIESDIQNALQQASQRLNVTINEDGVISDSRPDELRRIETRLQRYLRNVFENVDTRIRFDLPDVSDLLAKGTVELREHRGPWTAPAFKGGGLQRTLYLALLQTLADELRVSAEQEVTRPFILLFEEPEAFLHPSLQRVMGDTLAQISRTNQVVVATHSPLLVTPRRLEQIVILRQDPKANHPATVGTYPQPGKFNDPDNKRLVDLLKFSASAEFLFADYILVTEGTSDRTLLGACWDILREELCADREPVSLAIVDAGSKDAVPVWIEYLQAMGLPAKGLVDLDFLWNGAGRCLKEHQGLNTFTQRFWEQMEQNDLCTRENGKCKLNAKNKAPVFRVINSHLRQHSDPVRTALKDTFNIWVLENGEIEPYFGLSYKSKGKYAQASRKIRKNEIEIDPEIREILVWATTPKQANAV